jgi:hypothetical protein
MNLRHAAVLAVAGWYLIAPPPINGDLNRLATDAPIRDWQVIHAFDSAGECANNLSLLRDFTAKDPAVPSGNLRLQMSFCIAADDPRMNDPRMKRN